MSSKEAGGSQSTVSDVQVYQDAKHIAAAKQFAREHHPQGWEGPVSMAGVCLDKDKGGLKIQSAVLIAAPVAQWSNVSKDARIKEVRRIAVRDPTAIPIDGIAQVLHTASHRLGNPPVQQFFQGKTSSKGYADILICYVDVLSGGWGFEHEIFRRLGWCYAGIRQSGAVGLYVRKVPNEEVELMHRETLWGYFGTSAEEEVRSLAELCGWEVVGRKQDQGNHLYYIPMSAAGEEAVKINELDDLPHPR